jgi:hypothetical protein
MVKQADSSTEKYNLDLLRGWQRSQIKLLKEFAANNFVSQTRISGASGMVQGSHALGGKLTALTRSKLIEKVGKDENGQVWKLNDEQVDRQRLLDFIDKLGV